MPSNKTTRVVVNPSEKSEAGNVPASPASSLVCPLSRRTRPMISVTRIGRYVQRFRSLPVVFALLASSTTVLSWGNSQARAGFVVSGQSDGVAISSNLTIASLASANISLNPLQGSAPAPYNLNLTNSLGGNFSAGTYNLPVLGTQEVLLSGSTGLLTTTANSNIDGVSNSGMVSGSTAINNLNLKVLSTLLVPVLTINATTLTTASSASGTYGSLTASGTPTITGLAISVLGINVTALVEASAGALEI